MPDPTKSTLRFTDERDLLEEAIDRDLVAAGPWQEGTPDETKLCLVEVRDTEEGKTFVRVSLYYYRPMGRGEWIQWNVPRFDEVLRYAPIHA